MFDQVLNEVLLAAIVFILVPMMIIAAVLMITGRRKHNHYSRIHDWKSRPTR